MGDTYDVYANSPGPNPMEYYQNPLSFAKPLAKPVTKQQQQYNDIVNRSSASQGGQMGTAGEANEFLKGISENARVLPGVRPNVGYVPGLGGVNLQNMQMFEGGLPNQQDKWQLNPYEQRITDFFSGMPSSPFKKFNEVSNKGAASFTGRGYNYAGPQSDQERQLGESILYGDINPGNLMAYDQASKGRIRANQLSGMKQFAQKYYAPFVTAAAMAPAGFIGGPAGAIAGGGLNAFAQGAMTKFKDPWSIAAGAAGGALGGWGAGAGAQAMGAGKIAAGAMQGAGSALGRSTASGLARGNLNPYNVIRDAGIGAIVGGGIGGLQQLGTGNVINTPGEPGGAVVENPVVNPQVARFAAPHVGNIAGRTLDYYLPGRQEPPRPQPQQQRRRRQDDQRDGR